MNACPSAVAPPSGLRLLTPAAALIALLAAMVLVLSGCGGGGGGSSASSSGGDSVAGSRVAVQLSGVAANGTALTGARLQAIDTSGTVLGSGTTSNADGSYSLSLQPASGAILLQASGTDAAGQPLLLHSAIASPTAGSATLNISPLTEAALALALGAEPRQAFIDATASGTTGSAARARWTAALPQLAAAASFVKTLVKLNLTDAKVTDTAKLDLFGDATFAANKTGLDLALETLAVGYGSSSTGSATLLLGNKLGSNPTEVAVDLATAATELAKTGGTPATAITSAVKATTSPSALMAYLAKLDELAITLNATLANAVAKSNTALVATGLDTAGVIAAYEQNDGADDAALVTRLSGYAEQNLQLGRLQVVACLDETIDKTGCKRVAVAARLTDPSGSTVGSLQDAAIYDSKATPKARWNLAGNARAALLQLRGVAWRPLAADQTALSTSLSPVLTGVQVWVGSGLTSATVQTPGGYVLPLADCGRSTLCLSLSPDAGVLAAAHGDLAEDTVFSGLSAWLGGADTAAGAKYKVSYTTADGTTTITVPLRGSHGSLPAADRFATLDELSTSQPLTAEALQAALTVNWARWAARQPDMRVTSIGVVHANADGDVVRGEHTPASFAATGLTLEPLTLPDGFEVARSTLWIRAVDTAGRWYQTSIAAR